MAAVEQSQQAVAEQAVNRVAEKSRSDRVDAQIKANAEARFARQQQRLLQEQEGSSPEQRLRALAYAEGEGLRNTKEWHDAKTAARVWLEPLQDVANQKVPDSFFGTAYAEARKSYDKYPYLPGKYKREVVWENKDKILGKALLAQGEQIRVLMDKNQALREIRSFERKNKDAITVEQDRLLRSKVAEANAQRPVDAATLQQLHTAARDEAILNVRAMVAFEELQEAKVRTEVQNHPEIQRQVAEAISVEQGNKKRPLTDKEINKIRDAKIAEFTNAAMETVHTDASVATPQEQRAAIGHESFNRNLNEAYAEMGVTRSTASAEQADQAQTRAIELTRQVMATEKSDQSSEAAIKLRELRESEEWGQAYDAALREAMIAALDAQEKDPSAKPFALTSEVQERLQKKADGTVEDARKAKAKAEQDQKKAEAENTRREEVGKARNEADKAKAEAGQAERNERTQEVRVDIARLRAESISLRETANTSNQDVDRNAATAAEQRVAEAINGYDDSVRRLKQQLDTDPENKALKSRVDRAQELLDTAKKMDGDMKGKTSAEADTIVKAAESDHTDATKKREELQAKADSAEAKAKILEKTNVATSQIEEARSKGMNTAEEVEINEALNSETQEQQAEAIKKMMEAKKVPGVVVSVGLLALLGAILAGLGTVVSETGKAVGAGSTS